MNRNRRPGSGQITSRLIIVRAGHVIAARGTEQLAAPQLQPLRADDNTAKDLQYQRRDSECPAKAQRIQLRPVPTRPGPGLAGLAPISRRVPRLDGYSTVEGNRG